MLWLYGRIIFGRAWVKPAAIGDPGSQRCARSQSSHARRADDRVRRLPQTDLLNVRFRGHNKIMSAFSILAVPPMNNMPFVRRTNSIEEMHKPGRVPRRAVGQ